MKSFEEKYKRLNWSLIEEWTGIELNVNEETALNLYYLSFREFGERDKSIDENYDFLHWFMTDYFGLDIEELSYIPNRIIEHGAVKWKHYGMNLLKDERFKEYCRRNVDFWREGRGLENLELRK